MRVWSGKRLPAPHRASAAGLVLLLLLLPRQCSLHGQHAAVCWAAPKQLLYMLQLRCLLRRLLLQPVCAQCVCVYVCSVCVRVCAVSVCVWWGVRAEAGTQGQQSPPSEDVHASPSPQASLPRLRAPDQLKQQLHLFLLQLQPLGLYEQGQQQHRLSARCSSE